MSDGLCYNCQDGNHPHDRTPDGAVTSCPYMARSPGTEHPCLCPWRGDRPLLPAQQAPRVPPPHRCHVGAHPSGMHAVWCPTGEHPGGWQHIGGDHRMCWDCGPVQNPHLPTVTSGAAPYDEQAAAAYGVTRDQAYVDALRGVAAATVKARSRTTAMGQLAPEDGAALLVECERQLSALIALGYVPPDPGAGRRRLTS